MKIEKINDNQIRCTLTHTDLTDRQLKPSELAYGSEKAKSLFQDMMQQAAFEFGFEADDMPLMIEAIPTSSDSIVLIITKVNDPEELDTRFSKFAPSIQDSSDTPKQDMLDKLEGAEEFLNLLDKVKKVVEKLPAKEPVKKEADNQMKSSSSIRIFSFATIDSVINASHLLRKMYDGNNTLYKDETDGVFLLVLTKSDYDDNDFNKICNMLSEYGSFEKASAANLAFLEEHCKSIIVSNAIQQLSEI